MLVNLVIFFHGCCGVWPSLALSIHTCFMKGNCKAKMKRKWESIRVWTKVDCLQHFTFPYFYFKRAQRIARELTPASRALIGEPVLQSRTRVFLGLVHTKPEKHHSESFSNVLRPHYAGECWTRCNFGFVFLRKTWTVQSHDDYRGFIVFEKLGSH